MDVREEMLGEFHDELAATRKVLERIPEDKLTWKPHAKSMTLGQLAMHLATLPGGIATMTRADSFDLLKGGGGSQVAETNADIRAALDRSVADVEKTLKEMSEEAAKAPWTLLRGGHTILTRPRYKVWRTILLNHWYHHRAQVAVYLRLLDIPVPAIYGPSADEQPFS